MRSFCDEVIWCVGLVMNVFVKFILLFQFSNTFYAISGPKISSTNIANTWECSSCWVRNSEKHSKCMACETPRETKETGKNGFLYNHMRSAVY